MKRGCVVGIIGLLLLAPLMTRAVPIGYYPGLKKLIETADAIVILRIDRHLSDFNSPTLYSLHQCYIYQTLKGDIPKDARIELRLMNTEGSLVSPYAHGSAHLMFLMKKAAEDEPTEYRTLTFKGAQIALSPLGHEKAPPGETIEQKIRNVIQGAIAYEAEQYAKKKRFLKGMVGQEEAVKGDAGAVLYSDTGGLDAAVAFAGVPAERREKVKKVVRGSLADVEHLHFASLLLAARDKRDKEAFRGLIHAESLRLLEKTGERQMVHAMVEEFDRGEFLYADVNPRFFVTQEVPRERELEEFFSEVTAKPTTSVIFCHYHEPKNMMIGTKLFLVREADSFKIIFPVRKRIAQEGPEGDAAERAP